MKVYIVKRFYKYTTRVVIQNKKGNELYKGRTFNIPMSLLNKEIYDIEPIIEEDNKSIIKIIIKED
jgi:hypothetical protein